MQSTNHINKPVHKNHGKGKNYNPNPVKIVWNKDAKKPVRHSPEEYL